MAGNGVSETLEDYLIESEQTWSEFCQDPYPLLQACKEKKAVYSKRKEGHFLFEREKIVKLLTGEAMGQKKMSIDSSNDKITDFFSKWIFFREDEERDAHKRALFRSIQTNNSFGVLNYSSVDCIENLFPTLRRYFFESLVRLFFYCPEESLNAYYESSEEIFFYFQGGRGNASADITEHISLIKNMFFEEKVFEFDEDFFESAVMNAIIDGYEPLSDLCWNTIEILMSNIHMSSEIAFKIAISTVPSFRYVVRHSHSDLEIDDGQSVSGKFYCFLSETILIDEQGDQNNVPLSFGRGKHLCAGRGLVEKIVPGLALEICEHLRANNVKSIRLERHDSLGSEGVSEVHYSL